ncbi:MAG TPA: GTP 3',8-cyclase MoaA [Longimicrobiales bacterium]|nr:GTP 3',8-cyclase MoaA [Longimicrobiales bacterium]
MARGHGTTGARADPVIRDAPAHLTALRPEPAAPGGAGAPLEAFGGAEPYMSDGYGRRIEYLRISVTDKCNLRCVYCMPEEGLTWLRREQLLSFEEIAEIVTVMARMGLRRLRITGGEPLVRRGIPELVAMLRAVPGIDDIALSTNGVLLEPLAVELREAGVSRLNVSLDSLRPDRVDAIARRPGSFDRIMAGLDAAERAGFEPIKINTVVLRGRNDDELADFARMTMERPWHVRFIEVMPVAENLDVSRDEYVSAPEILNRVQRIGRLEPTPGPGGNGPATYFRFPGAPGTVGVITPMSHNYCDRCNRMRLTADGQLRPCLFGDLQTNLRDPLRRGEPLEPLVRHTLTIKPPRHYLVHGSAVGSGGLYALSQVGG